MLLSIMPLGDIFDSKKIFLSAYFARGVKLHCSVV